MAILDFDITVGDVCKERYPSDAVIPIADDKLSALCIPEGGHIFEEDHTFLFCKEPATGDQLFGIAYFRNKKDPTVKRGAVMKSIVMLSRRPFFSFYLPLLREALRRHMDEAPEASLLQTLVDSLNGLNKSNSLHLSLWGTQYEVDMPTLPKDHFAGASLLLLVQRFREDTMLLWWAVILQLRVIFSGQPANAVGNCCLAAPLLVAPLQGFTETISPYVPLSHPEAIFDARPGDSFICGVTNSIFEHKRDACEAIGVFSSGVVTLAGDVAAQYKIKVTGKQLRHIKYVLSGIERDQRGEQWVREQFRQYTEATLQELERVGAQGLQGCQRALGKLVDRPTYKDYVARREREKDRGPSAGSGKSPLAYYAMLTRSFSEGGGAGAGGGGGGGGSGGATPVGGSCAEMTDGGGGGGGAADAAAGKEGASGVLTTKEGSMLLFNLYSSLTNNMNLTDIEALVDAGAVARLSTTAFLSCESATVRKYAVQVLAHLSTSVKGQVSFLCGGVLPRIVDMLADSMPAVCAAAANCLYKISGLYIGVQAMLTAGVVGTLTSQLLHPTSSDLLLRSNLASTLLQVYRFCPDTPLDERAAAELATQACQLKADRELTVLLLQLLDVWRQPLLSLRLDPSFADSLPVVRAHIEALQADDPNARADSTAFLQADLVAHRWLAIPLVLAGVVGVLDANEQYASLRLARLSVCVLSLVADCNCGVAAILQAGLVERMATAVGNLSSPPYLFAVSRLLEVLCQHPAAAEVVRQSHGIEHLVKMLKTFATNAELCALCLPALGALKYMLLTLPHLQRQDTRTADVHALSALLELHGVTDRAVEDAMATVLRLAGLVGDASGRNDGPRGSNAAAVAARTLEMSSL